MWRAAGSIVAEKRDPVLDRGLDLAWLNLKINGTRFVPAHDIDNRMGGLLLRAKSENIAGLQLADLVVCPSADTSWARLTRKTGGSWKASSAAAPRGRSRVMARLPAKMNWGQPRYAVD